MITKFHAGIINYVLT